MKTTSALLLSISVLIFSLPNGWTASTTGGRAPEFAGNFTAVITAGETLTATFRVFDPDGQPLESVIAKPLDNKVAPRLSGPRNNICQLLWTVPANFPDGSYLVEITAKDRDSAPKISKRVFQIQVQSPKEALQKPPVQKNADLTGALSGRLGVREAKPPQFGALSDQSVEARQTLKFRVPATDPNGTTPVITALSLPPEALFGNGVFSWTPKPAHVGRHTAKFIATDTTGLSETKQITITVTPEPAGLPAGIYTLVIRKRGSVSVPLEDKSVRATETLTFPVNAVNQSGRPVPMRAEPTPQGATFENGTFSWTPSEAQVGAHTVTFSVNEVSAASFSKSITIQVTPKPVTTLPATEPAPGDGTSPDTGTGPGETTPPVAGSDTGGTTPPSGSDDPTTSPPSPAAEAGADTSDTSSGSTGSEGSGSGTSGTGSEGTTPPPSDTDISGETGNTDTPDIDSGSTGSGDSGSDTTPPPVATLTSHAPEIAPIEDRFVTATETLTFTVSATDADGTTPTLSAPSLPPGATFENGVFNWTPTTEQVGTGILTFIATDETGLSATKSVAIQVNPLPETSPPADTGTPTDDTDTPGTGSEGTSTTPPADTGTSTGGNTGTPGTGSDSSESGDSNSDTTEPPADTDIPAGDTDTQGSGSDSTGSGDSGSDTTSPPTATPHAPELASLATQWVNATETLTFTVTVTDADGTAPPPQASSLPAGATLTDNTFSWTPTIAQVGRHVITFTAVDDTGLTANTQVVIHVQPPPSQAPDQHNDAAGAPGSSGSSGGSEAGSVSSDDEDDPDGPSKQSKKSSDKSKSKGKKMKAGPGPFASEISDKRTEYEVPGHSTARQLTNAYSGFRGPDMTFTLEWSEPVNVDIWVESPWEHEGGPGSTRRPEVMSSSTGPGKEVFRPWDLGGTGEDNKYYVAAYMPPQGSNTIANVTMIYSLPGGVVTSRTATLNEDEELDFWIAFEVDCATGAMTPINQFHTSIDSYSSGNPPVIPRSERDRADREAEARSNQG